MSDQVGNQNVGFLMTWLICLNIWTLNKVAINILKLPIMSYCHRVMTPKYADELANSEDTDQTAPLGAV